MKTQYSKDLNKGYDDGFYGRSKPRYPNNEAYMDGYLTGQADGLARRNHLKGKAARKNRSL